MDEQSLYSYQKNQNLDVFNFVTREQNWSAGDDHVIWPKETDEVKRWWITTTCDAQKKKEKEKLSIKLKGTTVT